MSELFLPYLTVVGWVLGPVALGVLWGRLGAPVSASRKLFNFSFYGAQTFITLCSIWIARIDRTSAVMPLLATSGWLLSAGVAWLVSVWLEHPPERRGA